MARLTNGLWPGSWLSRINLPSVLQVLLLLGLAAVVLYPIFLLLFRSFHALMPGQTGEFTLENWKFAYTNPGMRRALTNTITLLVTRESIALLIAIPAAWVLARTDLPRKGLIELGLWVTFFLPALPVTMGWILLLDPSYGVINTTLERLPFINESPFNIYSWWGIIWVHLMTSSIAFKTVMLAPAFRNISSALEESSRMAGVGPLGTFRKVVLPLAMPSIIVITLIALVISFQSFEIELVLGTTAGVDVFSTKIFQLLRRTPVDFGAATALASLVIFALVPLAILQYWYVGRRRYTTVTGHFQVNLFRLGRWRRPFFGMFTGYLFMALVLPFSFLLMGTFMTLWGFFSGLENVWTLNNWSTVLSDSAFLKSLRSTLTIGFGSAIFGIAWFSLVAYVIVRTKFRARLLLDFLSWLPWALPGIILGLGFLWMILEVPILRPIHTTSLALIFVVTLGSITVGVQMFKTNLLQLGADMEDASRMAGGSWFYTYRRVLLPLMMPTVIAVGLVTFVFAARDVSRVALLSSSENRPLSLLQLEYLSSNMLEWASVVGVIIILLTTGVAILARVLGLRIGIQGDS
jgi:iron(III) transport system permease protein